MSILVPYIPPPPERDVPTADVDPEMVARAGLAPAPVGGQVVDWQVETDARGFRGRRVRRVYPAAGQSLSTAEVWDGQRWSLTRYSVDGESVGYDMSRRPVYTPRPRPVVDMDRERALVDEALALASDHRLIPATRRALAEVRDREPDVAECWAD